MRGRAIARALRAPDIRGAPAVRSRRESHRNTPVAPSLVARARALLDDKGLAHELLATLPGGATVPALAKLLADKSFDTVIAMGGDGTFAEAAKGVLASGRAEQIASRCSPRTAKIRDSASASTRTRRAASNIDVIREGHETRSMR